MSWNNTIASPNWAGNYANKSKILQVSTIIADQIVTQELYATKRVLAEYVETGSISSANGSIAFMSNLVTYTGVIALGISPTILTAEAGVLYVNGDAVAFPSSFSTIADWSQFKAVADVNMSRSSIYNVHSISTNTISTGNILANSMLCKTGLSTINISSANITYDTLNGRAGTVRTLSGSNLVYCNAIFSNINAVNTFTTRLNTSNIVASNDLRVPSISTIIVSSFLVEADTLYAKRIATGYLAASNVASFNISTLNLSSRNLSNVELMTLSPNVLSGIWDNTRVYSPGDKVLVSGRWYVALLSNYRVPPAVNLPLWAARDWYFGEAAFVTGLGSYICISNNSYDTPPNGHEDAWTFLGLVNSFNYIWNGFTTPPSGLKSGTIVGNNLSFIQVGTVSSIYLNASNINVHNLNVNNLNIDTLNISSFSTLSINVSTLNTDTISSGIANISNITSYDIYNSNSLSNGGNFSNAGDAQMNTLTTHGQVYTQNILNVNGLLALRSDMYGQTNPGIISPEPEFLHNIENIKNITCESLNIYGGSTNNNSGGIPTAPYRNNTIVNIGTSEIAPAVVTIGGVNSLADSAALTVYGEVAVELGSFNSYYTANFYPLNFEANAVNVYGLSYLNGGVTITGFTDCLGTLDVQGITTFTGAVNALGIVTIEGETNILGALTAEAGIGVVGFTTFQAGDIIIGDSGGGPTNNFNLYNYYNGTDIQNLTVNGNGDFRQNTNIDGNLTVGGIIYGTVVSGSESISTINVSTLRAFNISTITDTTQQLFVSSIAGYSNRPIQFRNNINVNSNIVASNNITALGSINTINTVTVGLRTSSITSYYPDTDLQFTNGIVVPSISTLNISTGGITIGDIFTNSISTTTLNIINGTGNNLLLQSYEGQAPTLSFRRPIDGIDFVDGVIGTSDETGFILAGLSTFTVYAFNDISIGSAENVKIKAENTINVSTNTFIVENLAAISSIYTNIINTPYIEGGIIDLFYRPDKDYNAAITLSRDIDGEKFGDGAIYTNNEDGFQISAASTMKITTLDDMLIRSVQGRVGIISDSNNIIISAPETLIPYNLNVSTISTGIIYADSLIAFNGIGTTNVTTSNLNTVSISTGSIKAEYATIWSDLSANNVITTNLLTYSIGNPLPFKSPVVFNDNLNISGNDIYNTATLSASNISTNLISSGSLLSGVISSIQFNASSINANRANINILTGSGSAVFTNNFYPLNAGAQIGFFGSGGTNSGGFYNNINVRSTNTQVLVPDVVGAFSNNIRVQGNLSTQNVFVSTINRKLYPYTSTFGILNSASTYTFSGTTATTPQVMYSNITFPHVGTYIVQGKNTISKATGGSGAESYGYFSLSRGLYPSTFNTQDAFNSVPFLNHNNISTFNTFNSEIYVSSMNTNTRFITYADQSGHNYTMNVALGQLRATYVPSQGINPE